MIVHTSMEPTLRSNSYLVVDVAGGHAAIIDTGAPIEPLLEAIGALDVHVDAILNTHDHADHVQHNVELEERFPDAELFTTARLSHDQRIQVGELRCTVLSTPGHCAPHYAFVVSHGTQRVCFTGDALFAGSVGGTLACGSEGGALLRTSIMETLMRLPGDTTLYPGHSAPTTIDVEREHNPFVRYWLGHETALDEPVKVHGNEATLLVWAGDYDGGNKALVYTRDGVEAVVGGSAVTRGVQAGA